MVDMQAPEITRREAFEAVLHTLTKTTRPLINLFTEF
jgi:hypothetical protein